MKNINKIQIKNLNFGYNKTNTLKNINFTINTGEITSIIGSNGAGKSTLIKCCNNLLPHNDNTIFLNNIDINKINSRSIANRIGYVPQEYFSSIPLSVFESVLLGVNGKRFLSYSKKDINNANKILNKLGISNLSRKKVNTLSGGQQQKVAIARALINQPSFVFLDEPTSSLDLKGQRDLMQFLSIISKENNTGVLIVLHDINLASEYSDSILMLKEGYIFAKGNPFDIMNQENIKTVFNLDVKIIKNNGRPFLLPT